MAQGAWHLGTPEQAADYTPDQRRSFLTFSPGDSITVGAATASIENIDVSRFADRGKIYLDSAVQAEPGVNVVSFAPSMTRAWRVTWGGLARDNTDYLHWGVKPGATGAVPCASLVHPDALGDRLTGWIDTDVTATLLKYEGVKGAKEIMADPRPNEFNDPARVWDIISKDITIP